MNDEVPAETAHAHRYEPVRVPLGDITAVRAGGVPQARLEKLCAALLPHLQALHRDGRVYGALSPQNVLLDERGNATLAPAPGPVRPGAEDAAASLAAGYAAFEQYTDDPAWPCGPWTDLYALSALLHTLVVGAPPPRALRRCINDNYEPLAQRQPPGYAPALLEAIDAGLAREPARRPQDVEAYAALLGVSIGAPPPIDAWSARPEPEPEPAGPAGAGEGAWRRLLPAALAAACLLSLGGWWWLGGGEAPLLPGAPAGRTLVADAGGATGAQEAGAGSGNANAGRSADTGGGAGGPRVFGSPAGADPRVDAAGAAPAQAPPSAGAAAADPRPAAAGGDEQSAAFAAAAQSAIHPLPEMAGSHGAPAGAAGAGGTAATAMASDMAATAAPEAGHAPGDAQLAAVAGRGRADAAGAGGPVSAAAGAGAGQRASSPPAAARVRVHLDIRPWGEVSIDGVVRGISPPVKSLMLAPGRYQVVVRNSNLPAYRGTLQVRPGQPAAIRHVFE